MLSFFPRDVLDDILNLIESVSKGFPTCSFINARKFLTIDEILIVQCLVLPIRGQ